MLICAIVFVDYVFSDFNNERLLWSKSSSLSLILSFSTPCDAYFPPLESQVIFFLKLPPLCVGTIPCVSRVPVECFLSQAIHEVFLCLSLSLSTTQSRLKNYVFVSDTCIASRTSSYLFLSWSRCSLMISNDWKYFSLFSSSFSSHDWILTSTLCVADILAFFFQRKRLGQPRGVSQPFKLPIFLRSPCPLSFVFGIIYYEVSILWNPFNIFKHMSLVLHWYFIQ